MPLGANVWTLDTIRFDHQPDARDAQGVQWILTEEKGFWGSPGTRHTLTQRLNKPGAFRSTPGWKKERVVTLTGRCYAGNFTTLRQAEANVCGLLSDPELPGKLTCYTELGAMQLDVFLDNPILCTPLNVVSEPGIEFSIQVVAPDPRKYSVEAQTQSTGLPIDNGDGLDFTQVISPDTEGGLFFGDTPGPTTVGLTFGTYTSGLVMLRNAGTAPTTPVYTLHGPLTNPVITCGGGTLKYNATLAAGEFVDIDPSDPSVLFGGTASRRELLYPAQFEAFGVPGSHGGEPGSLNVGLSHTGASTATGWLSVVYRSAWF
jgi:hypothetical protein